ncbi:hypothetical protein [Sinomonas humi]|uniref:Uncharacterized protein n=1 Tax=Sinomonas humi TaxID=1338436 RepID=A0A0B2A9P0_9MICC|nr:hypothetical protein [Sinomonas humi]KHL00274.1 hypothetical protein LK10_20615 [Sinomonas humi]
MDTAKPAEPRNGRDPIEGIDFYLRTPENPTPYTLCDRISDTLAGRRDARHLSTGQLAERSPGDPLPDLTPWARALIARSAQVRAKEENVLEAVIDPARREQTRLAHAAAAADTAAAEAEASAAEAEADHAAAHAAGPTSSEPVSAAEAYDSEEVRAGRRARDHRALLAGHRARADRHRAQAAEARRQAHSARTRCADLATKIEGAGNALDRRLDEHTQHTRRRLNTYARAIARRHPDAAIIPALAAALEPAPRPIAGSPALHAL